MSAMLPMADDVVAAAVHGSWCPKMCTFACPVAAATGRDEAVPWSLHREVADLAQGRSDASQAWSRLRLCSGCLACQGACIYEQDVPTQVIAARAGLVAAGHVPDDVRIALAHLQTGRRGDGGELPPLPASDPTASIALVVERNASARSLTAWATVADRAGLPVRFVRGDGSAHATFLALGDETLAAAALEAWVADVANAELVVACDESAIAPLSGRVESRVIDGTIWLLELLASGHLRTDPDAPVGVVTWHDPARLARVHEVIEQPREILRLLGADIAEVEGHGRATADLGVGMAMALLAPEAAGATTARRAAQLAATGGRVVTTGADEVSALLTAGLEVDDLVELVVQATIDRHHDRETA